MSVKIMDERKLQSAKVFSQKQALHFISEIKSEFKKVSWTGADELKVYTNVVVTGTFVFGMVVYLMDLLFQSCIFGLNVILRSIMG